MDVNDLKSRISRTLQAIDARYEEDVQQKIKIVAYPDKPGLKTITFGDDTPEGIEYKVTSIISNLANFKDNLKKKIPPQEVEDFVKASLHLKVLLDLNNAEKHGYPPTKKHSKLDPKIEHVRQTLTIANEKEEQKIIITGNIIDKDGNHLFSLDELIDTCFASWKALMSKHNLF